jgi:carboxyl-terminal processing protease
MPVTVTLEDFFEEHGLRLPRRMVSSSDFTGRIVFEFERTETGIDLDAAIFSSPSDRQPDEGAMLTPAERQLNVESFDMVWNIVNDRFWDRDFNGVDWEGMREELRPRVAEAKTHDEALDIMYELILSLGASHYAIFPADQLEEEGQIHDEVEPFGVPGIDLRVVDGCALVTSVHEGFPAAKAGVRPGWEILDVGGKDIRARLKERAAEIEDDAKKELRLTYTVLPLLFGNIGDSRQVTFLDGDDGERTLDLELVSRKGSRVELGHIKDIDVWFESRRLDGNIGYIAFNRFFDPLQVMKGFNEAMARFMDSEGLIIDIRGNEGGLLELAFGMMGWLIEERHELGTVYMRDLERKIIVQPRATCYDGKVAVLIDGLSGSAAEVMAGGLKDIGRARIIGTCSKGEVLPATFCKLPNRDVFLYTTDNFVSVTGRRPEGLGVRPDLEVRHTREALLEGRDRMIEAAVKWIDNQT